MCYFLANAFKVHWRLNRKWFIWLGLFVLVGMVMGIIMIVNPNIKPATIPNGLLDTNIQRVVRPNMGFGAIIFGRILDLVIFYAMVFIVCLNRWTLFLVFPLIAYRGFAMVINLYWAIMRWGSVSGIILFIVYLVIFLVMLVITMAAAVQCLRICAEVRKGGGFRGGIRREDLIRGFLIFLFAVSLFALTEWFLFWLFLSKTVFV